MTDKYRYDGTKEFKIKGVSTSETSLEKDKVSALKRMEDNFRKISELQEKLYAEKREGVIFLFQAMDAAGKRLFCSMDAS